MNATGSFCDHCKYITAPSTDAWIDLTQIQIKRLCGSFVIYNLRQRQTTTSHIPTLSILRLLGTR